MAKLLLKNATLVCPDRIIQSDLLTEDAYISKIAPSIKDDGAEIIDCEGLLVLPGLIDEHVHFRDPGMPQKATIFSESRAAVLGGVTSFLDMPNTVPPTVTEKDLDNKLAVAAKDSAANYGFYLGASGDNLEELKRTDPNKIAGIKVFMGSTTGNLLVEDENALVKIFTASPVVYTTHCELTSIIDENTRRAHAMYGDDIPFDVHPIIRNRDCCIKSTQEAINVALGTGARLHIMHISTKDEVEMLRPYMFGNARTRQISGEAALPHLFFSEGDYQRLGGMLKCNPAVKTEMDRMAIVQAVEDGVLTTIGTDHAPHEIEKKQGNYMNCASGCTGVQYSLLALMDLVKRKELTLETLVKATSTNVADRFRIKNRGRIQEGFFADFAIVNPIMPHTVNKSDIASPCGWSPFEGHTFKSSVVHTIVSGKVAVRNGKLTDELQGQALAFDHI